LTIDQKTYIAIARSMDNCTEPSRSVSQVHSVS